jgi:hypothetical protein
MTASRKSPGQAPADTSGRPVAGLGGPAGYRIPIPARERRPALAALALLLILGGALASAYLVMAGSKRVAVIEVAGPVAAGQRVPMSALEEVQVSSSGGLDYIPWSDRVAVTTTYAATNLVAGSLLTNRMTVPTNPSAGTVVVGLSLKPGQIPAGGLDPGDRVAVFDVGGATGSGPATETVLAASALVTYVAGGSSGGSSTITAGGSSVSVSVAVPVSEAPAVVAAASAGSAAVGLLSPGGQG